MNKKKITGILLAVLAVVITAVILLDTAEKSAAYETSGVAMGSMVTVKLYGKNAEDIAESILAEAEKTENAFISRYKETSEIYNLNKQKQAELSSFTADVLKRSIQIADDSDGAFDITLGKLSSLWNFDEDTHTVPDEQSIMQALSGVGTEKITAKETYFSIADNQEIDLGAVGKGLACDCAKKILEKSDIHGAVVSVGGSILVYGNNQHGKNWTVGIRTPEQNDTSIALKISINGTKCISTSGNYEKCFTENGKLYHHILSSETGCPADSALKSVTVISDCGLDSDALATACFVLGTEKSKSLLQQYNADAIFIDNHNDVYITESFFDSCEAVSDKYTLYKL